GPPAGAGGAGYCGAECCHLPPGAGLLYISGPGGTRPQGCASAAARVSHPGRERCPEPPGGGGPEPVDAPGGPGRRGSAVAAALGAGEGWAGAGGAAQWRGGYWQIAPGAGAEGACGP